MIIAGIYSFKRGHTVMETDYAVELEEIKQIIAEVDAETCRTKISHEQTMEGKMLYSPRALNHTFDTEFEDRQWHKKRVACDYSTEYYVEGYEPVASSAGAFREMDYVKNHVGSRYSSASMRSWFTTCVPK